MFLKMQRWVKNRENDQSGLLGESNGNKTLDMLTGPKKTVQSMDK